MNEPTRDSHMRLFTEVLQKSCSAKFWKTHKKSKLSLNSCISKVSQLPLY